MNTYKSTQADCVAKGFLSATEDVFAFGLIRHTKVNPNRLHTYARLGSTWFGSYENYDARIKRRWPIRFFLAKGFTQNIWWPLQRTLSDFRRAKHLRCHNSYQILLEEAIRSAIGVIPAGRRDVFNRLSEALPSDPDLVRRVDVSYGLSRGLLPKLFVEQRTAERNLVPRPGQGTKSILEYPEAEWIDTLRVEICRVNSRLARDATDLVNTLQKVEKRVE